MGEKEAGQIGLIVGDEHALPISLIEAIGRIAPHILVEYITIEKVKAENAPSYNVIVDRMSHKVPFYRSYLKHMALKGTTIINNPFTWSADDKFLGICLLEKMGLAIPRTVILPNKSVAAETTPQSFQNLHYPMDWEGIIDYVGVPAIFKEAVAGGRNMVYRVHNVDDLLDRYDQTGLSTMILQEIVESDHHIHCFVVDQQYVLLCEYVTPDRRYRETPSLKDAGIMESLKAIALSITQQYGYDINMVEFVLRDDQPVVINPTNPAPSIDLELLSPPDFDWCVEQIAALAIKKLNQPTTSSQLMNLGDWLSND